jgi:transcriptional regulator with XRE-family HTH domain
MISRIREIRRARRMTLQQVADACDPPTTAQTIGRLETGMRTVSVAWLNRIAAALGVEAADLVRLPERADLPVAALLGPEGATAPRAPRLIVPPQPAAGHVAMLVEAGVGEYRAGDEIWLERLTPDRFAGALNRDLLVPRPAGRFLFGRMIGLEPERLLLLPLGSGGRQMVVSSPSWAAVAVRLIRPL